MMNKLIFYLTCLLLAACSTTGQTNFPKGSRSIVSAQGDTIQPILKTEKEWRQDLSKEAFFVLRNKGTEKAFSGKWLKNKDKGQYVCVACQLPLFSSETKFKSGTGWPSFYDAIDKNFVKEVADRSDGMNRRELRCARCDGHLGHVFNDGPRPTGQRYCINSASLDFVSKK